MFVLLLFIAITKAIKQDCSKNYCQTPPQQVYNVFLASHPHLDPFWIKTFEEYYRQPFKSIYIDNVKNLYNLVLSALKNDSSRTYTMSEVCFIKRWYKELSVDNQTYFRQLLKEGRIEILNGGWVQNDEALTHYDDIISQLTLGGKFLNDELGLIPEIAFNIDNFGHSMVQASIYSQMGYKFYVFAREDTNDIESRTQVQLLYNKSGNLEFVWEPQPSTGVFKDRLITHIRYKRHKDWPWHYDSILYSECMIKQREFKPFEEYIIRSSIGYASDQVLYIAGDDFQIFDDKKYETLQALIDFYDQLPCKGFKIKLSTVQEYFLKMVEHKSQQPLLKWQIMKSDFIPHWEDSQYWTGFYTTSPDYKLYFRNAGRILQSTQKLITSLFLQGKMEESILDSLQRFQEEVALSTHHDGITGTSKYYVLDDVVFRIKRAWNQVNKKLTKTLNLTEPELCQIDMSFTLDGSCIDLLHKYGKVWLTVYNVKPINFEVLRIPLPEDNIFHLFNINKSLIQGEIYCEHQTCVLQVNLTLNPYKLNYFYMMLTTSQQTLYPIQYFTTIPNGEYIEIQYGNHAKIVMMPDKQTFKFGGSEFHISLQRYYGRRVYTHSSWGNRMYNSIPGKYIMQNDNNRQILCEVKYASYVKTNLSIIIALTWTQYAKTYLIFETKSHTIEMITQWDGLSLPTKWTDYVIVFMIVNERFQEIY